MKFNILKKTFVICIIFVSYFSCNKKSDIISSEIFLEENLYTFDNTPNDAVERLPISVHKLKQYIGAQFEPIGFKVYSSKSGSNEEFALCYKETPESNAKVTFFTVLPNETLRKQHEFSTAIKKNKDFSIQVINLFEEDDSYILIEGLDEENRRLFYILSNNAGGHYDVLTAFTATYSIFYDFVEKENESTKYFVLKEIVLLNNALSATNTIIQRRDVYIWDYQSSKFTLKESTQIVPENLPDISSEVLYSSENYFQYITGFWYLSSYQQLIDSGKVKPEEFSRNELLYAYFYEESSQKKVHIHYGDYADIYIIDKIIKTGSVKPGLRFTIRDPATFTIVDYRYVDLYLNDSSQIFVKGPEDFTFVSYSRLPKPFIEYIEEVREKEFEEKIEGVRRTLQGVFKSENFEITIKNDDFSINSSTRFESGKVKFFKSAENIILFLMFSTENQILGEIYFIIDIVSVDKAVLLTVAPGISGYSIKNKRPITLTKKEVE